MTNLTPEEWKSKLLTDKDAVVLDVRTADECNSGMLENAKCLNIFDKENFIHHLGQADKEKSYYIYCRSGQRSTSACRLMESLGFKNTFNLVGGLLNWTEKIL
jgi:rhodanese-related sulfurtransferase